MPEHAGVMLVHGLFGGLDEAELLAPLAARVVSAPELLGYGALRGETVSVDGQVGQLRETVEQRHDGEPIHLVAHSVGAVFAFEFAHRHPELVLSIVDVEGNFTLADAFWSQAIAEMSEDQARESLAAVLASPGAWLASSNIEVTRSTIERARRTLALQPWRTVWSMAREIVDVTARPTYDAMARGVLSRTPVHLVAGERSRRDWHVPRWALDGASSFTVLPRVGHLMPVERPRQLGELIATLLAGEPSAAATAPERDASLATSGS